MLPCMASDSRPGPSVRDLDASDAADVARALARAFEDDPIWTWILPDDRSRLARLARLFEVLAERVHGPHGGCEVAGREEDQTSGGWAIKAAALWDPPGCWKVPIRSQLRNAGPMLRVFGRQAPRALRMLGKMEAEHPTEPHWYLSLLGTDPEAQGSGLGGALLRSRLHRCDADRLPAYLESSKPENVPYYERFGFKVTQELTLPGGCPPLWLMWREPDPA